MISLNFASLCWLKSEDTYSHQFEVSKFEVLLIISTVLALSAFWITKSLFLVRFSKAFNSVSLKFLTSFSLKKIYDVMAESKSLHFIDSFCDVVKSFVLMSRDSNSKKSLYSACSNILDGTPNWRPLHQTYFFASAN